MRNETPNYDAGRRIWDEQVSPVVLEVFAAVVRALNKCADNYTNEFGKSDYHYGVSNGIRMAASLISEAKV